MAQLPKDPRLREWAEWLDRLGWSFLILDNQLRLAYVSEELTGFLGTDDPELLGIGDHMLKSFLRPAWIEKMPVDDQMRLLSETMPFLVTDIVDRDRLAQELGDPFATLLNQVEVKPMPQVWSSWFRWKEDDLPPYRVDMAGSAIRDELGDFVGAWFVFFMGLRPSLLVLLSRGNEAMYERMSKLVDPKRRQAAILFVDLEGSGLLSRQLSTAAYFQLVRKLSTCIDDNVAQRSGVVGKHAGDGASALFLVEDLESPSAATAAAIESARALVDMAPDLAPESRIDSPGPTLNVGLHWGGTLYVGQLVPGGRLDVAALGDEMNECARIQEAVRGGTILASKALLEQLEPDDAARLGLDLDKVAYRTLADLPTASDKAVRDAGGLAVMQL